MMNASRLLAWGDLEAMRRRRAAGGVSALSPWVFSALAALVLGLLVARAMGLLGARVAGDSRPVDAANLWIAVLAAGHVVVLLGAPFRMYWRHDSMLLGRMAIPGRAVFSLTLIRSLRAAAKVALPCALAALMFAFGPAGSWNIALRHLALLVVAFIWAGIFGPVVALGAGAVVASDRTRAALASLTGEFQPPRTSWLGLLPGFAGTLLVLIIIACVDFTRGGATTAVGSPYLVLGASALLPPALLALAMARADRVMVHALREVAALDQERLAHVERTQPSALERAVARMTLASPAARLVLEKDASLARRRYPIPFFLGVCGVVVSWIVALTVPDDLMLWSGVTCACLGVYGVIMARRYVSPPIEHMRFARTLPIADRELLRAKRVHLGMWIAGYMLLGAAPVVARAPAPLGTGLTLAGIMIATWIAGLVVTARS